MQSSLMATAFPAKPRQSCHLPVAAAAAAAAAATGSSVTSWKRRRQQTASRCLRVQQHSALESAQARSDHHDIDDSDRLSPSYFHPSIWGDFFLQHYIPADFDEQQAWMKNRAEVLKEEVRSILSYSITLSLHQRLHLIGTLERLCLDYLFEEEINSTLAEISNANVTDYDLQTVAAWFCLLRKHRYMVSSDVFVRFKDEQGRFLAHTPMDLLNLYNAASLRTHGDIILDEAALFTGKYLQKSLPYMKESLAQEIKCALEIPLPRRVSMYELKDQIHRYESEAIVDEAVIQLAKLNSNIMQLCYQRELEIITRWWKDLDIELKLPFARDRIVECFWWMLGVYFEPYYSRGRIILTMVIAIITLIDDIYDSYATAEDCELFTKCMESWDLNAASDLPECMKFALSKIFDSYQTIEDELANMERYRMLYLKNFRERTPTLHVASTIDSFMKEHNVSIEIAREKILELKEETWKDFNSEWLSPENSQPKQILNRIFNLARTMEFFYNKDDNFTNGHNIKDKIHSLFVEPFTII